MAKIETPEHIKSIKGKVDGDGNNYYSRRFGSTYLVNCEYTPRDPSPAQLAAQEKFKNVLALVAIDMAAPETKAQWQEKANQSNGKYKTARGAAFAYHYATYEEVVE